MKMIVLIMSLTTLFAHAADQRLNYAEMASEAFQTAEDLAIDDNNCPVTADSFKTNFKHPKGLRYDYDHILYKDGVPYAGFKNQGFAYSYHQAFSGQWEYRIRVKPGKEVRFQKFKNRGSKLIVSGNQSVAKMDDFLKGPVRMFRVFCAVKEIDKVDGFGNPSSTRYTDLLIQTPNAAEAKNALKECVTYWFVQPLKNDFCKDLQ